MDSGSSSQQNFKKAIEAIKDSTSVGMAKVNCEFKAIKVSILKATSHIEVLPKEKHVRAILGAVSGSRPRADVSYCIRTLRKRLSKTHSWVVTLKTLIVIHRALREVDHSFCEELIYHNQHRGRLLNLIHFKDESSPRAWNYSTWIRAYALYIEECVECFRVLRYDFYRDHTRTKKFDIPDLLEQLPPMQLLLHHLLCCEPDGAARYNFMIQYALSIVAAESVRLYVAITDGVLILVDKYFEMQRGDAVRALEIYRNSVEQAQRLSEFFEICRSLEFGRRQKYAKIEQPPASFLTTMEEYIKRAPQAMMLPCTANDDACVTPIIAAPDPKQVASEEGSLSPDDSQETIRPEKSDTNAPPMIPDLLSWDEPSQETSESDRRNSLALILATPEESPNTTTGSAFSNEPASWELALVTTSPVLTKASVLDRSVLDSLYEAAQTKTNTSLPPQPATASSNPFEADHYAYNQNMFYNGYAYNQNMFYDPNLVAHPSFTQIQQQAGFMQHCYRQEQSMVPYDYMQIGGPTQQPPPFTDQNYQQQYLQMAGMSHHQQKESLFSGHDFMQTIEMPQFEVPMQQQEKSVAGLDSSVKLGNPFEEQSSLSAAPQNQDSDFSLL